MELEKSELNEKLMNVDQVLSSVCEQLRDAQAKVSLSFGSVASTHCTKVKHQYMVFKQSYEYQRVKHQYQHQYTELSTCTSTRKSSTSTWCLSSHIGEMSSRL